MATNPETVAPQTPERDPLAVLRDEGRAKMVAALRTRKATLQQIKDIAKEHAIKIENEDALKKNIAYTRIPGSDLSLVGEFIFGSTPPQEAPAATISQYEPTFQEQAYTQIYNAARSLGADKSRAQYFAERLAGRRGGDISLLDLTPAAALTDVPTGIEEVQRGLRFDEPGTAALGALQTGLGLLEAVPVVGAGVKAAKPTLRQARNVIALADVARRTPTGDASRQAIEALSPSQVPPTPITPMARIAQAPEIPPTRITPRAAAAAPETAPASLPSFSPRPLSGEEVAARAGILQGEKKNRVSDLSQYAPRIYRETDFDSFRGFLPWEDFSLTRTPSGTFVADTPDMALGQGSNRGVLLEFDAEGVLGTVNEQKPAWQVGFGQGLGSEFFVSTEGAVQLKKNLRAIRIADEAQAPSRFITERRLKEAGWVATRGDGFTEYTRPAPAAAAPRPAPPTTSAPSITATPASIAKAEMAIDRLTPSPAPSDFGIVDRAGNINLRNLGTTADAREAIRQLSIVNKDYRAARRGKMTVPEIQALASKVPLENLLGRKVGQAFNAEELEAARDAVLMASKETGRIRDLYAANPTDQNLRLQLAEALLRQSAFQEQLAGGVSEVARALRMAQEAPAGARTDAIDVLVKNFRNKGKQLTTENIDELLDNVVAIGDNPEALAKFIGDMRKPTFWDKIIEFRAGAMLYGPETHSTNILSNVAVAIARPFEELGAATIGKLTRSKDAVTFREVGARTVGLMQGTADGWRAMKASLRGEELADEASKIEGFTKKGAIGVSPESTRVEQIFGKASRVPLRALVVADEFFKAVNRRSETAALAYRASKQAAPRNAARQAELYNKYLNNPTKQMQEKANEFAREMTFQTELTDERLLSSFGKLVAEGAEKSKLRPIRLIAPFIRTPVNIVQYGIDRSVLAPLTRTFWRDIKTGGAARDRALARLTMGAGSQLMILDLARKGYVTGGGPADPKQRRALMATGWQPYSFHIGDKYYSYARIEPFATVVGMAADFNDLVLSGEYDDETSAKDLTTAFIAATASALTDKTFTRGMSELAELWTRPEVYGESFVNNFIASFYPNISAQTARAIDPTLRQPETFADVFAARTPGLTENVMPRLDVWGDPIVRTGYANPAESDWAGAKAWDVAWNLINPVRVSQADNSDPVRSEVVRLNLKLSTFEPTIRRTVTDPVTGEKEEVSLKLNAERYNWAAENAGKIAHQYLVDFIPSDEYKNMNQDEQAEEISGALSDARSLMREIAFELYADKP